MPPFPWQCDLDADTVSAQIEDPNWPFRTDPDNWEEPELMHLVGEEINEPLDAILVNTGFPMPAAPESLDLDRANLGNFGYFASLPEHLFTWTIMPLMDYKSILALGQTCYHARVLVSQHSMLRLLLKHCPNVFPALHALGIIYWSSIKHVIVELQSSKCRGCGETGTYLFLPTIERVCSNCLRRNPAFWPIALYDAIACFALEDQDLSDMLIFRNTRRVWLLSPYPGAYYSREVEHRYLVAVKSALQKALKIHGSREKIETLADVDLSEPGTESSTEEQVSVQFHRHVRRAVLGQLPCDPTQVGQRPTIESTIAESCDERIYSGTATIGFPHVPRGEETAVKFYRCLGCDWIIDHFTVCPDHLAYMGICPWWKPNRFNGVLMGRVYISRNKDELLEHARSCLGAGLRMWRQWDLSGRQDDPGSSI